jgi:hypothetical protein
MGHPWSIYSQAAAHNKDKKNPAACWRLSYKKSVLFFVTENEQVLCFS